MTVAVKRVKDDIAGAVSAAMEAADYRSHIPPGSSVFLKVNLGWDLFIPGSITNPAVFEGVVRQLAGYARKLYVVESDQVLENVQRAYEKSKIREIAERLGVEWVNLSRVPHTMIRVPGNRVIQDVPVPKILTEGLLVTLPVMKTHNKTVVTLSLKNQWGCIPRMRHMYHLRLTEAISDVNLALRPRFAVVDGTIALEGKAPKTGRPREVGIVGAGGDLVEVDSVFARLMGFDPRGIPHLVEAQERGLGRIGTVFIGDALEPIEPFLPARHNIVSRIEMGLRTSFLRRLAFEPPLFWGMLLGAKIYYLLFEVIRGRRIRKRIRRHRLYGKYFEKPDA